MKGQKKVVKISKSLSLILRHQPDVIGIKLDENGWARVPELIAKFSKVKFKLDKKTLEEVVANNDKKRFSFNDDHSKIRANQGHSISVDLSLETKTPPKILYHGTVERFLTAIFEDGLIKGSRQHVHLSTDVKTANKVGARRGLPILLEVAALKAHEEGIKFYLSDNGVWLTDYLPPQYLKRI